MCVCDIHDFLWYINCVESFKQLIPTLDDRLLHSDHVPIGCYWDIISKADVVVSTAQHEFFGVAMYALNVKSWLINVDFIFKDGSQLCRLLSFMS